MLLIEINGEYQCPKCFKFFSRPDKHRTCVKSKHHKSAAAQKESLNTVENDVDAYRPSWRSE